MRSALRIFCIFGAHMHFFWPKKQIFRIFFAHIWHIFRRFSRFSAYFLSLHIFFPIPTYFRIFSASYRSPPVSTNLFGHFRPYLANQEWKIVEMTKIKADLPPTPKEPAVARKDQKWPTIQNDQKSMGWNKSKWPKHVQIRPVPEKSHIFLVFGRAFSTYPPSSALRF